MIKHANELPVKVFNDNDGSLVMTHFNFNAFEGWNDKARLFAIVELEPGKKVDFHMHHGENETYHFLSGEGLYSDNGTKITVTAGDTTFCPAGEGHGVVNTGTDLLRFIAMIITE